jgi:hypothetical protein
MATNPIGAFINGHIMPPMKQPGRGKTGNASANDRDLEAMIRVHLLTLRARMYREPPPLRQAIMASNRQETTDLPPWITGRVASFE